MASEAEGCPLGMFKCQLCSMTAPYSYVGQKPPNTQAVVLLEESYIMKDPFTSDKDRFLVLGSRCSLCGRLVCVGPVGKQWCRDCLSLHRSAACSTAGGSASLVFRTTSALSHRRSSKTWRKGTVLSGPPASPVLEREHSRCQATGSPCPELLGWPGAEAAACGGGGAERWSRQLWIQPGPLSEREPLQWVHSGGPRSHLHTGSRFQRLPSHRQQVWGTGMFLCICVSLGNASRPDCTAVMTKNPKSLLNVLKSNSSTKTLGDWTFPQALWAGSGQGCSSWTLWASQRMGSGEGAGKPFWP